MGTLQTPLYHRSPSVEAFENTEQYSATHADFSAGGGIVRLERQGAATHARPHRGDQSGPPQQAMAITPTPSPSFWMIGAGCHGQTQLSKCVVIKAEATKRIQSKRAFVSLS